MASVHPYNATSFLMDALELTAIDAKATEMTLYNRVAVAKPSENFNKSVLEMAVKMPANWEIVPSSSQVPG